MVLSTTRTYEWVWHGSLKPCPRPKVARRGGTYYPADYRQHLRQLRDWFEHQSRETLLPANARYRLKVTVYKRGRTVSKRYGDLDNLLKTVMDIFPFDDARITEAHVTKLPCDSSKEERVVIQLSILGNSWNGHDNTD